MIFQRRELLVLVCCVTIMMLTRTTTATATSTETTNSTDTLSVFKESRGVPSPGPITTTANPTPTDPAADAANQFAVSYINKCRDDHNTPHVAFDKSLQTSAKAAAKLYGALASKATTPIATAAQIVYQKYFPVQIPDENPGTLLFARTDLETTEAGRRGFEDRFTRWYTAGVTRYNYEEPQATAGEALQFFTQMMWKSSTKVGCACDTAVIQPPAIPPLHLCSCIFSPAGNIRTGFANSGLALYKTNVLPLK